MGNAWYCTALQLSGEDVVRMAMAELNVLNLLNVVPYTSQSEHEPYSHWKHHVVSMHDHPSTLLR